MRDVSLARASTCTCTCTWRGALDEEVEEGLGEGRLLGEGVGGQAEEALELRAQLDDEDAEDAPLELHRAVRLAEALLLGRERGDRISELGGRGHCLEEQRDRELVLVAHLGVARVGGARAWVGGPRAYTRV